MNIKVLVLPIFAILLLSFYPEKQAKNAIEIQWVAELGEDFSFAKNWSYGEGIYKNMFGQISCDGFCPDRAWGMKDENGMILSDSLEAFYQLVDTAYIYHSIESKVNMYEYSGTNFIEAKRNGGIVKCFTKNNVSTHSSLLIELVNNSCIAKVDFNSITNISRQTFLCKNGNMIIDKNEWDNGVLKAKFDFTFENNLDEKVPLTWKGLIYKKIEIE